MKEKKKFSLSAADSFREETNRVISVDVCATFRVGFRPLHPLLSDTTEGKTRTHYQAHTTEVIQLVPTSIRLFILLPYFFFCSLFRDFSPLFRDNSVLALHQFCEVFSRLASSIKAKKVFFFIVSSSRSVEKVVRNRPQEEDASVVSFV